MTQPTPDQLRRFQALQDQLTARTPPPLPGQTRISPPAPSPEDSHE